jgi:hypothetical protein
MLVTLAVIAAAVALVWWTRTRKTQVAVEVPAEILGPDAAALRALERLRAEDLVAHGELVQFYQRLDEILRSWLQARFDIPAMERTTRGIGYHLRMAPGAMRWRQQYLDLLTANDAVKYARLLPSDSQALDELEQARAVISLTSAAEPAVDSMEVASL